MSLLVANQTVMFGAESVERAALVQIRAQLDDRMTEQDNFWADQDAAYAVAMGIDPTTIATVLERVQPGNYYTGHVPGLINAPITGYPNVACIVPQVTPASGTESVDQGEAFRPALFVDVMVKSQTSEEDCNRRSKRTVEAVNACLMEDQTLGGIVTAGFESAPQVLWGDCFVRKEKTSYGERWYWLGARIEYAVRKEAVNPGDPVVPAAPVTPPPAGSFLRAGIPAGLDIDQA